MINIDPGKRVIVAHSGVGDAAIRDVIDRAGYRYEECLILRDDEFAELLEEHELANLRTTCMSETD